MKIQSRPKLHGGPIGSTLASHGGLQDLRLWTLVTQQLAIFRQNPPLEKYRGKWENGRPKISGGFWGSRFFLDLRSEDTFELHKICLREPRGTRKRAP